MLIKLDPIERLLLRATIHPETGCWEAGHKGTTAGYVTIRDRGKGEAAHIRSARRWLGYVPTGETVVCHRCDNPKCFNPHHLFVGSQRENVLDMIAKGRRTHKGGGARKLSKERLQEVFDLRSKGLSHYKIAAKVGVCRSLVGHILMGLRYKGVLQSA